MEKSFRFSPFGESGKEHPSAEPTAIDDGPLGAAVGSVGGRTQGRGVEEKHLRQMELKAAAHRRTERELEVNDAEWSEG